MEPKLIIVAAAVLIIICYLVWKKLTRKNPESNPDDVIVAQVQDMKDGEMKSVKVHEESILLVKDKGSFCAVGNACTHLLANLDKGSYLDGKVRCPWHGACFDTKTGDIEDYPGVLNIPTFPVRVEGQNVIVTASPEAVAVKKVVPKMAKRGDDPRTFVIVGAGAAGGTAAFQLRQENFTGRIILIGAEKHLPYDRTKLSKALTSDPEKIALRSREEFDKHDIELILGVTVTKLNADSKKIFLSDGNTIEYSSCLVATGANPLRLEKWIKGNEVPHKNVFVLRTADQGPVIAEACKEKRVAIVGSSFIGVEVAAAIVGTSSSVTVIGMENVPFERVLGSQVGSILQKMHENKNVKFKLNAVCSEFKVGADDNVHTIILKDGSELACDVVIIGAGVSPATQFLEGKSVERHQDQSIICDKFLSTRADGLYVAGDLARFPLFCLSNESVRIEHWGIAQSMGKVVAKNMVTPNSHPFRSVPVFWTASYGKSVRYAGHGIGVDSTLLDTFGETQVDPDNPKFIAYYCRGGLVIAISSMNADPVVADFAQLLGAGIPLYAADITGPVKAGKSQQYVHDALVSAATKSQDKKSK